jgi:hypothetical protein
MFLMTGKIVQPLRAVLDGVGGAQDQIGQRDGSRISAITTRRTERSSTTHSV